MGRAFLVFVIYFVVVGCGSSLSRSKPPEAHHGSRIALKLPITLEPSPLSYILPNGFVFLGDSVQFTLERFKMPVDAMPVGILPTPLTVPLKAYGWQSPGESLGLIAQGQSIVLFIHTLYKTTWEERSAILEKYESKFQKPTQQLIGPYSEYRFWELHKQRLMISSSQNLKGDWNLTVVLGEVSIMDALRMNPKDAKNDQAEAQSEFNLRERPRL